MMQPEVISELNNLDQIILDTPGTPSNEDSIYKYDLAHNDTDDIPDHVTPEYAPMETEASMKEADSWYAEAFDHNIWQKSSY